MKSFNKLNLPAMPLLIALLASLTAGQTSFAQTIVHGTVIDQNGAAIAGAKVSAIASRSSAVSAITNEHGAFSLTLLIRRYSLAVSARGFAETTMLLDLNNNPGPLHIVLPVAETSATVTVVAADALAYHTETLSSATRTLTALRDVPQSITVVTKDQIRDQSMESIADVVNYVPGITAHQGENNRDQIVIRGNSTSADFFLNGVRDDVQYYRDLYNVDRVEALKGPNAMAFGRGGGGGVINRVTKHAGFAKLHEVTVQGGSFGNSRVTGDFDQPLSQNIAVRINGVYERGNSFRRFVSFARYGINPTLTFRPGANTTIVLAYEHFHDRRVADRGIPSFAGKPADIPVSRFFGNPKDSHVRASVDLLSAVIDHQFHSLNIRNRTLSGNYDRGYQNFVPGPVNSNKTLVSISAYNNRTRRQNVFNQTDLTYFTTTGKIKHVLLAGSELGRQVTHNFRNTGFFNNTAGSVQVAYDDPLITIPVTFRQSATDADNRPGVNLAAVYLQDQIQISRQIEILAGLRFDYFDLKFHNNRNGENVRRIDRLLSPRAGIVFKPVRPLSIYASYSVGHLPGSGDQFASLTTLTQQVKPENFSNYELGAKWDIASNLALTSAIYRQDRTNTRSTDPNDPARIVQTGSQQTKGYEMGLSGSVTRSWSIVGGYAYQNAFITVATTSARAGAQVAQVPHHAFSLWNKYQVRARLGLGIGVIHRSQMFAAIDDTVTLPGYTRIDTAVYVPFNERFSLQAHFENLLNRKYYLNADGNNNISPGSPRAGRVGLITRF